MATIRVSNVEAKADAGSPTIDERVTFKRSTGENGVIIDSKQVGITSVGINTDNPQAVLDVSGGANISDNVIIGGTTPATLGTELTLRNSGGVELSLLCGALQQSTINMGGLNDGYSPGDSGFADGKIMYDNNTNHMQFNTAGSERLRISSDGTVSFYNKAVFDTTGSSDAVEIRHGTDTDIYMSFYCEENTAQIADTFAGSTDKKYINFNNPNSSNDPGFIMHETRGGEANEGVLHLVPSDDNSEGDYISIHGTNDPDVLKLHTSGLIETAVNYQLELSSDGGTDTVKVASGLSVDNDLYLGNYISPDIIIRTATSTPTGTGNTNYYNEDITGTFSTVNVLETSGSGAFIFHTDVGGGGAGAYQFYDTGWRPKLKIRSGNNNGVEIFNGDDGMVMKTIASPGIGVTVFGDLYVGTGNGSLTPPENSTGGGLYVGGALYDGGNGAGTSGQVLTSTGTGVDWIDQSSLSASASFDGLTGKTSGTGEYSTSGALEAGRGTGGVALTVNDGYGNANVTFNHKDGTPEQTGKAGRIEVNTDSTTGDATMSFGLGDATSGVAADVTEILELSSGTSSWSSTVTFNGLVNFRGNVDLADNDILRFGSGDDCEMFVNGSHMYMDLNSGIGNFYIRDGTTIRYTFNDNGNFTATGNVTGDGGLYSGGGIFSPGTASTPGLNNSNTGFHVNSNPTIHCSRNGGTVAHFNRNNSNGTLVNCRRGGNSVGTISVTSSATSYNTSSDYRLKENIVPMTGAIDRVKALNPCRFNFIVEPGVTVDGFLAHEAQTVVPECVTGEKDAIDENGYPEYQGIDQSKIVPLLTKALQEALTEIDALKARLDAASL